jgi:membrane associated rhomboid family serine protease
MHFGNIKSLIRKIAFNMVTFYFLGREVERNFGSKCLMKLYLLGKIIFKYCFLGIAGGVLLTNY